jgi:hypothetical protein
MPATGPYTDEDKSSLHHHNLLLKSNLKLFSHLRAALQSSLFPSLVY